MIVKFTIFLLIILILSGLLALCIWTLIKRKKKKEEEVNKLKEEMIDNKELDTVGAEMNIEASDYEEAHEEEIKIPETSNIDNETSEVEEKINEDNEKDMF